MRRCKRIIGGDCARRWSVCRGESRVVIGGNGGRGGEGPEEDLSGC